MTAYCPNNICLFLQQISCVTLPTGGAKIITGSFGWCEFCGQLFSESQLVVCNNKNYDLVHFQRTLARFILLCWPCSGGLSHELDTHLCPHRSEILLQDTWRQCGLYGCQIACFWSWFSVYSFTLLNLIHVVIHHTAIIQMQGSSSNDLESTTFQHVFTFGRPPTIAAASINYGEI